MSLRDFIRRHTVRGPCMCGRCEPQPGQQPTGHTADMVFFKVSAAHEPDVAEFKRLIAEHQGDYGPCNPLDGKEHGFMELGAWLDDQGLALMFMGLGSILGVWTLLTPYTVLGPQLEENLAMSMAGSGLLSIQHSLDAHPDQKTS